MFTKWQVHVPGVTYNSRAGSLPKNNPLPFDEFVGTKAEAEAAGYKVIGGGDEFQGTASPGLVPVTTEPDDYVAMYGGTD